MPRHKVRSTKAYRSRSSSRSNLLRSLRSSFVTRFDLAPRAGRCNHPLERPSQGWLSRLSARPLHEFAARCVKPCSSLAPSSRAWTFWLLCMLACRSRPWLIHLLASDPDPLLRAVASAQQRAVAPCLHLRCRNTRAPTRAGAAACRTLPDQELGLCPCRLDSWGGCIC